MSFYEDKEVITTTTRTGERIIVASYLWRSESVSESSTRDRHNNNNNMERKEESAQYRGSPT